MWIFLSALAPGMDHGSLPNDVDALKAIIARQRARESELEAELADERAKLAEEEAKLLAVQASNERLARELAELKQRLFSRKNERMPFETSQLRLWPVPEPPPITPTPPNPTLTAPADMDRG